MFPTDRALSPVRLGVLVEQFGFESLFLPEHSHVPYPDQEEAAG